MNDLGASCGHYDQESGFNFPAFGIENPPTDWDKFEATRKRLARLENNNIPKAKKTLYCSKTSDLYFSDQDFNRVTSQTLINKGNSTMITLNESKYLSDSEAN